MRTGIALAVMSLVLLFVWERVDVVRVGYHIERLKSEKAALERERDELRVKLSGLTAPDRIARVAMGQLGMVRPRQGQVILVKVPAQTPDPTGPASMVLGLAKFASTKRSH
ncbi:MAG: cell division protein FtsL [Nitrospirae bacterium]|nr:cell division protein FtsL [Nitrospirota bacterium]